MTDFRIEEVGFDAAAIDGWSAPGARHINWPVVYLIDNGAQIYVGETTSAKPRLQQHLKNDAKKDLRVARIVIDGEFNKSACLDLESRLIGWLIADQKYAEVLNRNDGQTRSDYFEKSTRYEPKFDRIFRKLHDLNYFDRPIHQIEELSLFKLSPYKALTDEQAVAVEQIVEDLTDDLERGTTTTSVIEGGPGTGKTIIAIYLLKLIRDIASSSADDDVDRESRFSDFYLEGYREQVADLKLGFVVPQMGLRETIRKVFKRIPALRNVEVLSQYDPRLVEEEWGLLVVDETHRLHRYATHPSDLASMKRIRRWYDAHDMDLPNDSLGWIAERSKHRIFLVDGAQSVRPNDIDATAIRDLITNARREDRYYSLEHQLRVQGGHDYIEWARALLSKHPTLPPSTPKYDLRFYESIGMLRRDLRARNRKDGSGLSLLLAGNAWSWPSLRDKNAHDIEIDGVRLVWNRTRTDWPHSKTAREEVGSIHTIQGYDLNFAGVIIGPDIVWDKAAGRIRPNRQRVADSVLEKGTRGDDDALFNDLAAAYFVMLTRGMLGTYVYVCDPDLRDHLRRFLPPVTG